MSTGARQTSQVTHVWGGGFSTGGVWPGATIAQGAFEKCTYTGSQAHLSSDSDKSSVDWEAILAIWPTHHPQSENWCAPRISENPIREAGCAREWGNPLGLPKPCRLTCVLGHVVLELVDPLALVAAVRAQVLPFLLMDPHMVLKEGKQRICPEKCGDSRIRN